MRLHKQGTALVVGLLLMQSAWAQDSDRFKLSGFGTFGVAHSTEDKADVTPDFQAGMGVGASDATSARLDSRAAIQLDAQFTDNFSGVVQAVSEYAVTRSYSPKISLAHLKYRFGSSFSARLGRISAPLYMLSESQRVGYAMSGARPPVEVYNYLLSMDGVEGQYNINLGETVLGIQGFYGHIDSEDVDVQAMRGLAVQLDRGASTARIAHVRGTANYVTDDLNTLFNTYLSIPNPTLNAVVKQLDPRAMKGQFSSVGYSYDPGNWFLRTEVIQADYSPSITGRTTSGYATVGIRRGDWTPSLTVAHVDLRGQATLGALDPLGVLNQAVARQNSSRHSYTAALRWDVHSNIAVKLQASHIKNHAGSYGSLSNIQPGFVLGGGYNLVSASVDFVF